MSASSTPTLDRPDTLSDPDPDQTFRELTGCAEQIDDGSEKDRFAHYVSKEDIVRSAVEGIAVFALCGKEWTPRRNPDKYPVCPTCKKIYQQMQPGDDQRTPDANDN